MAILRHVASGRLAALPATATVGRATTATVSLVHPLVSGVHAVITWEEGAWSLRDAGSRNGTWVDGVRVRPGERLALRAEARVAFGEEAELWVVADAGPPTAIARGPGGRWEAAADGVLLLPSPAAAEVAIFHDPAAGWVTESAAGLVALADGDALAVAGETWTFHAPEAAPPTRLPGPAGGAPGATLRLRVSRDEEFVEVAVVHADRVAVLATRAHAPLVLALARARLDDAGEPAGEQGWRYADDLARGLALDKSTFNLHVFRARQQLAEAGLAPVSAVIERRMPTGQVRLGVAGVQVGPIG